MIEVDGVTKAYGTGSDRVRALDDVTLEFDSGTVTGLLGPNGAGKTTLMKVVLGLVEPTRGRVRIDGFDVRRDARRVYRRTTAVLEGSRNVYWRLTPLENMAFFASLQGIDPRSRRDRHRETLTALGLDAKADEPVHDLSRGMKQTVAIACALARETPALLLDEPTLGLDVSTARKLEAHLRRLAAEREGTLVVSSHDMDLIQRVCDRIVLMDGGGVIADATPEALLDVFATDRYRIVVQGSLPTRVRTRLARTHDLDGWEADASTTSFRVARVPDESLHPLFEDLGAAGVEILEVAPIQPDLEDVFVELTDGGSTRREVTLA